MTAPQRILAILKVMRTNVRLIYTSTIITLADDQWVMLPEQCRHPLLLRFFCEAYRGQEIGDIEDIRLKELFDSILGPEIGLHR